LFVAACARFIELNDSDELVLRQAPSKGRWKSNSSGKMRKLLTLESRIQSLSVLSWRGSPWWDNLIIVSFRAVEKNARARPFHSPLLFNLFFNHFI